MRFDPAAGGAVPLLGPEELAAALPADAPELELEAVCNLPSSHFTVETLWEIRNRVVAWCKRGDVDGVVVTHGTDTLEETAYLLDLTVPADTPIALTGAMRAASEPGYDGPANLWAALRVAASPSARGLGALVVFNDEVHAARWVTKVDTLSPATFQSPGWGPIGRVEGDAVLLPLRLRRDTISCPRLEPRVALVKLGVAMDPSPLEDAVARGSRGIVIEGLGAGRVPPWWLPSIREAISQGIVVVIASRCPSGRVWDAYGYTGAYRTLRELGCLFSPGLNGQKARIRLMAVLGATEEPREVVYLWQGHS